MVLTFFSLNVRISSKVIRPFLKGILLWNYCFGGRGLNLLAGNVHFANRWWKSALNLPTLEEVGVGLYIVTSSFLRTEERANLSDRTLFTKPSLQRLGDVHKAELRIGRGYWVTISPRNTLKIRLPIVNKKFCKVSVEIRSTLISS